jgi:SAM-dependent methyltransferase
MLTAMSAQPAPAPSVHRLPRARLVDRTDELRRIVRGRTVVDLGFVDPGQARSKRARSTWLHETIRAEARAVVGVDADAEGVEEARQLGFDARVADVEDPVSLAALGLEGAEVVVAGELIEHLDQPGAFLEGVKLLLAENGVLVLTTPNGHALTNVLGGIAGRELVNPDHVAWFSWRTLVTLLGRHGWQLDSLAYYTFPKVEGGARAPRVLFSLYQAALRPVFRLRPNLADGIVAVARLA